MITETNTKSALQMPENTDYKSLYEQQKVQHQFTLSQISHEIRNPVTLVNSFLQLLEGRYPNLREDDYWQKIMENMDFLKSLLNELSAFNNSEKMTMHTTNLYLIFCEIIDSVAPTLEKRGISISLKKETPIPVIQADNVKIRQLLMNLIRNAADAITSEGCISCTISSDAETVSLTVTDTGNGIPSEYNDLFEPFITHKQEGTGLGLPICKRITEAHHGIISYESVQGKGTTFRIVLPVC